MIPLLHITLAQATDPEPVEAIREGFGLLVIVMALGVTLLVIALGLALANRRAWTRRTKRRHPGPKVDAWRESASRIATPTASELERHMGNRKGSRDTRRGPNDPPSSTPPSTPPSPDPPSSSPPNSPPDSGGAPA